VHNWAIIIINGCSQANPDMQTLGQLATHHERPRQLQSRWSLPHGVANRRSKRGVHAEIRCGSRNVSRMAVRFPMMSLNLILPVLLPTVTVYSGSVEGIEDASWLRIQAEARKRLTGERDRLRAATP